MLSPLFNQFKAKASNKTKSRPKPLFQRERPPKRLLDARLYKTLSQLIYVIDIRNRFRFLFSFRAATELINDEREIKAICERYAIVRILQDRLKTGVQFYLLKDTRARVLFS